ELRVRPQAAPVGRPRDGARGPRRDLTAPGRGGSVVPPMSDRPTPLLDRIQSPADLQHLDQRELGELATEIRAFIVDAVNRHGGHLGSNLGVVEITLALHRVFRSPHDIILWDTGHQAYVHKLLTGRQADFATLRQEGGLSGYPSRSE